MDLGQHEQWARRNGAAALHGRRRRARVRMLVCPGHEARAVGGGEWRKTPRQALRATVTQRRNGGGVGVGWVGC